MIACICGGILETIILLLITMVASLGGTNWYNKRKYKQYVEKVEKHKHCKCDCHKDDET